MEKKVCYGSFVPAKVEKYQVVIGTKVTETMSQEIDAIAAAHDRTNSYVIRELLTRGLEAFRTDGILKPDVQSHKAPVVARIHGAIDPDEERRRIEAEIHGRELKPTGTKLKLGNADIRREHSQKKKQRTG